MTDDVLQFDPKRRTNAQAIVDCVTLGYLNEHQLTIDLTYGEAGGFWKLWRPENLWTNDLHHEAMSHHDYTDLHRWVDAMFDVTVFDPPYKLNGTGGSHESDRRFGVARPYRNLGDIQADHEAGLREAVRITKPGGFVLYKTKDQVTCTRYTKLSTFAEIKMSGFDCSLEDELYVNAYIPQPKNRTKKCPACKGTGWRNHSSLPGGDGRAQCFDCDGSGRVKSEQEHFRSNCSVLQIYHKPRRKP